MADIVGTDLQSLQEDLWWQEQQGFDVFHSEFFASRANVNCSPRSSFVNTAYDHSNIVLLELVLFTRWGATLHGCGAVKEEFHDLVGTKLCDFSKKKLWTLVHPLWEISRSYFHGNPTKMVETHRHNITLDFIFIVSANGEWYKYSMVNSIFFCPLLTKPIYTELDYQNTVSLTYWLSPHMELDYQNTVSLTYWLHLRRWHYNNCPNRSQNDTLYP